MKSSSIPSRPIPRLRLLMRWMLVLNFYSLAVFSAHSDEGEEILRQTLQLYGSAGYYSGQATIEETIQVHFNSYDLNQTYESDDVALNHSVSLEFTRPDSFNAFWSIVDSSNSPVRTGSLQSAAEIAVLSHQYPNNPELVEDPDQYENLQQAIDHSEIASLRFTTLMRDFLDPAFHEDLLTNEITLAGTRKLGKVRCYVLELEGYKSLRLWIDRKNFALYRIEYALDRDTLLGEAAWLEWKLSQAQLNLDPDEDRIQRRIDLYRDPQLNRSSAYTLTFGQQSLQP